MPVQSQHDAFNSFSIFLEFSPSFLLFFLSFFLAFFLSEKPWETEAHMHIGHAPTADLHLASGNTLERLAFGTFIITRKEWASKWAKQKNKKNKSKQEIRRSAFIRGAQCWGPSLPVRDPSVTPITPTFKNAVKEAVLPLGLFVYVCVCVCLCGIPPRLSPPSLDKNYIIAACDLIFLKEHFEVSFPLLFPLSLTCFNAKMTLFKLLSSRSPPPLPSCRAYTRRLPFAHTRIGSRGVFFVQLCLLCKWIMAQCCIHTFILFVNQSLKTNLQF